MIANGTATVRKRPSSKINSKTRLFAVIVVLTNVLGNTALTAGMKKMGSLDSSPLSYLKAILSPWVLLGITLLILWMLTRMTLLSWADLSYVLPVTSVGYILQALIGKYLFAEQISGWRWSGTLLIVAGIALVGLTSPRTTARDTT
jgi:uncharacterized membrane protein